MVKDDGKGFDETTIKKGNGLKNLKARADEVKGNLQITSLLGEGTYVFLRCNL